jgi:hypothetical protein
MTKQISQNIAALLMNHTPFLEPTMCSIESSFIIVEFSTEKYSSYTERFAIKDFSHSMVIQNCLLVILAFFSHR